MKIATRLGASVASSQTVALGDTYRFISTMSSYGYKTVSWWASERAIEAINYVGQGTTEANAMCIECSAPTFAGTSTKIELSFSAMVSNNRNRTFCYAVTYVRDDTKYMGAGKIATAQGLVKQGTVTLPYVNGSCVISLPCDTLVSGEPFILYFWRLNQSYGNVHITSAPHINVYSTEGALAFQQLTPYIYTNNAWEQATDYIYSNNAWHIRGS